MFCLPKTAWPPTCRDVHPKMSALELSVVAAYALLLLVLSVYGSHRYLMAYLYYRHKYRLPTSRIVAMSFCEPRSW